MSRVSCIIPAYNEAARIGAVLAAAAGHPALAEVIVVDDGSRDGTAEIAAAMAGVRVIRQPQNGGKTRALVTGIAAASGELLLFLDADLEGLTHADISALVAPVAAGGAEVSISLRRNAPALWRRIGLDYISGERVMPRRLLDGRAAELNALPKFGFEVFLNRLWLDADCRIAVVRWDGVASPWKNRKYGLRAGLRADLGMLADIFRVIGPGAILAQIFAMRRRRIAAPPR